MTSNLDLIALLRAPCGESLTLLIAEGGQEKFDPLRLAAAREIERTEAAFQGVMKDNADLAAEIERLKAIVEIARSEARTAYYRGCAEARRQSAPESRGG